MIAKKNRIHIINLIGLFLLLNGLSLVSANVIENAFDFPGLNQSTSPAEFNGEDWWQFELKAGQGISAALTAHINSGQLHLKLYGPDKKELKSICCIGNSETGILSKKVNTTGTYYLKITGSTGRYDLALYTAWYNVGIQDGDRSFHSSFDTAHYIREGNHPRASMPNGTGLSDYYRFRVEDGSDVIINLSAQINSGQLHMSLYGQDREKLESICCIGNGETETLTQTVHRAGVYYLGIVGGTGHYDLVFSGIEPDQDQDGDGLADAVEDEHGIDLHTADSDGDGVLDADELIAGKPPWAKTEFTSSQVGVVRLNATNVPVANARFNTRRGTDEQWWQFALAVDQGFTAALTAHINSGQLNMKLYGPNEEKLESVCCIENGEIGVLNKKVSTAGTYFLKVTGAGGNYDLAMYSAWYNTGTQDSDRNFHSSFETAFYIKKGDHPRSIMPDGTGLPDYYRFTAREGSNVIASLTPHINSGQLHMTLYGPDRERLESVCCLGNGETKNLAKTVQITGTYYLTVTGATGHYDLDFSGIEPDPDDVPVESNRSKVQKMYIAYYGRPADNAGLDYWVEQLDLKGGNLTAIIEAFGTSGEFTDRFGGKAPADLVNNIYQFLFGRLADSAGLQFYVDAYNAGTFTLPTIALNILDGSLNEDATIVANKLAAAEYFTKALKSRNARYGADQISAAKGILDIVGGTESSVAASKAQTDADVARFPKNTE